MNKYSHIHSFKSFNEMVGNISEGLIKTYDLHKTIDTIKRHLCNIKLKYIINDINYDTNVFDLEIDNFNYLDNIYDKFTVIESTIVNMC